ncbi:MAG TPA: ice-binding family protein, partial [Candidatus Dormibacteraeota bacterium]|nr:ice-binding family protein [Candidatus Dormibacteraeota bacterium]
MRRILFKVRFLGLITIAAVAATWPMAAQAATNPALGSAAGFAVLAGTAASCTTSSVTGNVGVNFNPPTTAGCNAQFAPGAYHDFQTALTTAKPTTCTDTIGSTFSTASISLGSGTHCTGAGLTFTDQTLKLTGPGPWNFVIGAGFTATNLKVVMANSGNPCNVFWWVGAAATLTVNKPVSAPFKGTILGAGAITITGSHSDPTALTLTGRVWATTAVTITDSTIVGCNAAGVPGQRCEQDEDTDEDGAHHGDGDDHGDGDEHHAVRHANDSEGSRHRDDSEGCDSEDSHQ